MNGKEFIERQNLEIELILEALFRRTGFDFRKYSKAHIKRRLHHRLNVSGFENYIKMLEKVVYNNDFLEEILLDLSINVTEMFRDPLFYREVREKVIPYLKTYPFVKIWHAGCSTGQEVYSMAILLEEEEMNDRVQIYATDFNEQILKKAREGVYPLNLIKDYTANYQKAGGKYSFSDYYLADYNAARISRSLINRVLFSFHNLVTDGVFGEMNCIFCRNVIIYFNKELQNKVLNLFYKSLVPGGFLCLGSKESLKFSSVANHFETISEKHKIFRKRI